MKDYSFIRKLKFDLMGKNLIGFGSTKAFEVNLDSGDEKADTGKLYTVNESKFGRIYDIQYNSEAEIKCLIACRVQDFRQVAILDLHKLKRIDIANDKSDDTEADPLCNINYKTDSLSSQVLVKIGKCMKRFAFADGQEKYLMQLDNGYYS